MTDMEQQQKEVRKKALKLLEHMDRTEILISFLQMDVWSG